MPTGETERQLRILHRIAPIVAVLAFVTPAVSIPQAASAAAVGTSVSRSTASQASSDARALRQDVAAMLQKYLDAYGDRFSPTERNQLLGYKADADRKLAAVVLATSRLQQDVASGASSARRKATASAAQSAWRRAKATADATMGSAQQIMQPKLSLMEQLGALRDYDTMTTRFDELGAKIDFAAKSTR